MKKSIVQMLIDAGIKTSDCIVLKIQELEGYSMGATEALKEISKDKYELNPWTVGPSAAANIALGFFAVYGKDEDVK